MCVGVCKGNEYLQTVARCLQMMLRITEYRHTFLELDGVNTYVNYMLYLLTCIDFQPSVDSVERKR